jgi:hypothetical protein
MSWLDAFLQSYNTVQLNGVAYPQRQILNLIGSGISIADDAATESTNVTISGGGGSSVTGTGLWYSTAGTLNAAAVGFSGDVSFGALSAGFIPTTVTAIQGIGVSSTPPTKGQFLVAASVSSWAPTSLSGDVSDRATTPGMMEVVGLLSNALPSLSTGYLEWTGSAWAFGSPGGSVTWTDDLAGSTSTAQYVAAISGNAGGGGTVDLGATVNLTALAGAGALTLGAWTGATTLPTGNLSWAGAAAKTLSFVGASTLTLTGGAASTWSLTSGTLTLSGGTSTAGGINLQYDGATLVDVGVTTSTAVTLAANKSLAGAAGAGALSLGSMTGATALPTGNLSWAAAGSNTGSLVAGGAFTLTAGAASTWKTSSGALTVDSAAALNLGTTNATSVVHGNATNTTSVSQTVKTGGTMTGVVNATTVYSFGAAAGDFLAFGVSPASAGFIRIPTGAQTIIENGAGTQLFYTDSGPAVYVNSASEIFLCVGGTAYLTQTSASTSLAVSSVVFSVTAATTISFAGAGSGTGSSLTLQSQNAVASGSSNGGALNLVSGGANGGSGGQGNIVLGLGGTTNAISISGLAASIGAFSWSAQLLPALQQTAPTSDVATNSFVITSQAPYVSASTHTNPGSIVLNTPAPVSSGSVGLLLVQSGGTTYAALGQDGNGSGYGALWLGQSSPSTTNYSLANNGTSLYIQASASVQAFLLTSGSIQCFQPLEGAAGTSPFAFTTQAAITTPTTGTLTLTATQYALPIIPISISLTGALTIVIPNQIGFYIFDLTGVTFNSLSITFKCGTATTAAISVIVNSSDLVIVIGNPRGTNTISMLQ